MLGPGLGLLETGCGAHAGASFHPGVWLGSWPRPDPLSVTSLGSPLSGGVEAQELSSVSSAPP